MTDFLKLIAAAIVGAAIALAGAPLFFSEEAGPSDEATGLGASPAANVTRVMNPAVFFNTLRSDRSTFCLDFYSTSTATRMKMTASSTATIEGVDGVMVASYGACP